MINDTQASAIIRQHRRDRRIALFEVFAVLLIGSAVMLLAACWLWSVLIDAGQPVTAYGVAGVTLIAIGFIWWVGTSVGLRRI